MVGLRDVGLAQNLGHLDIIGEWEFESVGLIIVLGAGPDELGVVAYAEGDGGSRAAVLSPLHPEVCFVYYYALIQSSF